MFVGPVEALPAHRKNDAIRARDAETATRTNIAASPSPSRGPPTRRRQADDQRGTAVGGAAAGAFDCLLARPGVRPGERPQDLTSIGVTRLTRPGRSRRRASLARADRNRSGRGLIAVGCAAAFALLLLRSLEACLARHVSFDVRRFSLSFLRCALECVRAGGGNGPSRPRSATASRGAARPSHRPCSRRVGRHTRSRHEGRRGTWP